MEEVHRFEMTPHPVEFDMYYSVYRPRRLQGYGKGGREAALSVFRH